MYHVQMKKSFDRGGDKWMSAWEGAEYNTQEEAFDMLDEYLEEAKGVPVQNFWDDIYNISRSEKNKRLYPTQKPSALLERIIKSSCPPGGSVLDPFCGSGTTAVACKTLNRNCVTMDINPRAVEIASEQLNQVEVAGSLEDFFH